MWSGNSDQVKYFHHIMAKIQPKNIQSNPNDNLSVQHPQKVRLLSAENLRLDPVLLDTLAQLRTETPSKPPVTLVKRAKAKFLTNGLSFPLIDLNSPLKKSYWLTWHCTSVLLQEGQKITSRYCNNRWCIVCNRIRTAKLINGYFIL